jgi:hypothetical protein
MTVLLGVYVALGVKSFKEARRARAGAVDHRRSSGSRPSGRIQIEVDGCTSRRPIASYDMAHAADDGLHLGLRQKIDLDLDALAHLICRSVCRSTPVTLRLTTRPGCQSVSVSARTRTGHVDGMAAGHGGLRGLQAFCIGICVLS